MHTCGHKKTSTTRRHMHHDRTLNMRKTTSKLIGPGQDMKIGKDCLGWFTPWAQKTATGKNTKQDVNVNVGYEKSTTSRATTTKNLTSNRTDGERDHASGILEQGNTCAVYAVKIHRSVVEKFSLTYTSTRSSIATRYYTNSRRPAQKHNTTSSPIHATQLILRQRWTWITKPSVLRLQALRRTVTHLDRPRACQRTAEIALVMQPTPAGRPRRRCPQGLLLKQRQS